MLAYAEGLCLWSIGCSYVHLGLHSCLRYADECVLWEVTMEWGMDESDRNKRQ